MTKIFEKGDFNRFAKNRLDDALSPILEHSQYANEKTTVFVSHKHEDLDDLKGILGFLEAVYDVKVYIDSKDQSMPKITSAKTAYNIKNRIKQCNKFILLATNGAIESKWCNWELGYGDAQKFERHIALFPMKPQNTYDAYYKGLEYLSIYPHISYYEGTEICTDGTSIPRGFYVRTPKENGGCSITPLSNWFKDI